MRTCDGCEAKIGDMDPYILSGGFRYCSRMCRDKPKSKSEFLVFGKLCYFMVTKDEFRGERLSNRILRITSNPTLVGIRKEIPDFPEFQLDDKFNFAHTNGRYVWRIQTVHSCD